MSDLQERGAWTGSSIDYRTDGLHVLATNEVSEIDAALDHLHGLGDLDFPQITAATFRDLLGASRKFAIALLDHFDHTGVTTRVGDTRRLRS